MDAGASPVRSASRPAPVSEWLPQFCSAPTLFAVMLAAELVALVAVLAPGPESRPVLLRLGVVSLYVQWLALLNAVVLCSLRGALRGRSLRIGFGVSWVLGVAVTALGSAVVCRMDQLLGLGFTVPIGRSLRFVAANTAIAALMVALTLRYLYVTAQWRGRIQAVSKAQVEALQARIRPHFLFNSMNTIASLIRSRPREAERAVEDLADLFRAAFDADGSQATLGDELELVERYLSIERLRLGERLVVQREVAADVPLDFAMPRLLLQPLVENAIHHGIQPRADGGTLELAVRRLQQGVEILIRNPLPSSAGAGHHGVAQGNVRARIGYHFGAGGELAVERSPDRYTVRVRLPQGMRV